MAQGVNLSSPVYTLDIDAPAYWNEACAELRQRSAQWAHLIDSYPDRALRSRGAPFETLLRSLIGQQISVKAAEAVWSRFAALLNPEGDELSHVHADRLLALSEVDLRQVGLSGQKVRYAKALADFYLLGELSYERLAELDDRACETHLCQVKGIGPWTAQMFLMFCLRRPDVWPVDDLGIQRGLSRQFLSGAAVGRREAAEFGEHCKPWRTVAAWYLWRSLDPVVIDY